jgi:hypothetical protein
MFLSKKHISRRTLLRGAGVSLALPLLDSMVPAQTPLRQTPASPVRRFVGIWHRTAQRPAIGALCRKGPTSIFRSSPNRWNRSAIA